VATSTILRANVLNMKKFTALAFVVATLVSTALTTQAQPVNTNPNLQSSADQSFWQSIDKANVGELRLYLNQFPNGIFASLAKQRIADATAPAQGQTTKPSAPTPPALATSANGGWTKHNERYFVRGDEVADRISRLVWRRCIEGTTWDGRSCQGSAKLVTGEETKSLKAPWRLPTVYEYLTIKQPTKLRTGLFIDDLFSYQPLNSAFATTTPVIGQQGYFWYVQFHLDEEHCFEEDRKKATLVRLVRPLTEADRMEPAPVDEWVYMSERFRVKGAEILDTKTALIWKRCAEGMQWNGASCSGTAKEFAWVDVRRHASAPDLVEQGYRVPDRSEVRSIFEKNTCSYEAMSDSVFDDVASNNYFWSTSVAAIGASGTFVPKMDSGRGGDANRRSGITMLRMVRPQNR
jgi:Protein of unknown function (DUF1566)